VAKVKYTQILLCEREGIGCVVLGAGFGGVNAYLHTAVDLESAKQWVAGQRKQSKYVGVCLTVNKSLDVTNYLPIGDAVQEPQGECAVETVAPVVGKVREVEKKKSVLAKLRQTPVQKEPERGDSSVEEPSELETHSESIQAKFAHLESLVELFITPQTGGGHAMVVVGGGGIGKSHSIYNTFSRLNFKQITVDGDSGEGVEDLSEGHQGDSYLKISGSLSPTGLYTLLYTHRESIVVLDDTDSVLQSSQAVNILKAALDTQGDRIVTWKSAALQRSGVPPSFAFKGRVLLISNKSIEQIPQPVLSRAWVLDMRVSPQDVCDRARELGSRLMPNLTPSQQAELVYYVESNLTHFKNVSLRLFVLAEPIVASGRTNWKELVKAASGYFQSAT
jgi:hypothetical protein